MKHRVQTVSRDEKRYYTSIISRRRLYSIANSIGLSLINCAMLA